MGLGASILLLIYFVSSSRLPTFPYPFSRIT
jgi:hypothetical protein